MPSDSSDDIYMPHILQLRQRKKYIFLLIIPFLLFLAFLLLHNGIPLFTDWLWFKETGYTQVFIQEVESKSLLFTLFATLFFLFFYGNLSAARRFGSPEFEARFLREKLGADQAKKAQTGMGWLILIVSAFLSLWAGRIASDGWANWLEFTHPASFHLADPIFHNDIGFYVFRTPFLGFLATFLLLMILLTLGVVIGFHVLIGSLPSITRFREAPAGVRAQILLLLALLALTQAFATRLGAYSLLQNDNGIFTGAGFTDIHYGLLALNVETIILILTAIFCIASLKTGTLKLPIAGIGLWFAALMLLGGVVPEAAQTLQVLPNQFSLEKPYIERNIHYTRLAYNLQNVKQVDDFPADQSLNSAGLAANQATITNVRIWDYNYLGKVYQQLQTIKPYYKFQDISPDGSRVFNIDIDRYRLGGKLRQVMLAAREMDVDALPQGAQTWQNRRLGYTHGYGLVMSPVNRVQAGNPEYFIQGFPPVGQGRAASLTITRPQIYYGMLDDNHVYVDTQQQEFDYPASNGGSQDHYTNYKGSGGIWIGNSLLRKFAFAARLSDWNLLLANNLTSGTRLLWRRDIRDRLQKVAPFLQEDGDPYLTVDPDNGHLVWIVDEYTLSDRYPYSTPHPMTINPVMTEEPNYIRNSVKATIDAYTGKMNLYLADTTDPIARAYSRIFPGLLKPMSAMPAGLKAHIRYPEDLFRIQRSVYATYHVDDPRVFYLKEDVWAVPDEPNEDPNQPALPMEPYYVVMHLPDLNAQKKDMVHEEFVMMSPLTPVHREDQNILGWMCARCDAPNYGQLVLYRFPQEASVLGPSQVLQRINSDRVISPQLSLLRAGGSEAHFGNMLVIPVDRSLLYIAPLYVEASNSTNRLPKMAKVVVAFGDREAMADTLEGALSSLFPGYGASSIPEAAPGTSNSVPAISSSSSSPVSTSVKSLIQQASSEYDAAEQKLKQGDFGGYGKDIQKLKQSLQQLKQAAGTGS